MISYETRSRVASDGTLRVKLPAELADAEVRVTVEATSNGVPPTPLTDDRPRTREEWRAFIRETRGSIPDFPDVERPGPDDYERREL
jgi:hypothetical protein